MFLKKERRTMYRRQIDDESRIRNERLEFAKFCVAHKYIYLYGAGNYAQSYCRLLQEIGIVPAGCIVTSGQQKEMDGIPVYQANDIEDTLTKDSGVIGAFDGVTISFLQHIFPPIIDCFVLDEEVFLTWINELILLPIFQKLRDTYPVKKENSISKEWKDILVIRLDALGDLVFTTAFLRELHNSFPNAAISLVIHENNATLFENCPYITNIYIYSCKQMREHIAGQFDYYSQIDVRVRHFCRNVFQGKIFDVVLLPRELLCGRTAADEFLMAFYCDAHYRFGRMRDVELPQRRLYPLVNNMFSLLTYQFEPRHEVDYMLDFLKDCGGHIDNTKLELWCSNDDLRWAEELLQRHCARNKVCVILGIVASDPARTWDIKNYWELIFRINEKYPNRYCFIFFGDAGTSLCKENLEKYVDSIIDLTGKTNLVQATACMSLCNIYVGSNTGLLHMAAALGKPVVEISATLPDVKKTDGISSFRMGPYGVASVLLQPLKGLDDCRESCKKPYAHCINQIKVNDVMKGIERLMREEYR